MPMHMGPFGDFDGKVHYAYRLEYFMIILIIRFSSEPRIVYTL